MLRLQSDLVELCQNAVDGKLDQTQIQFDSRAAVGVVLAAGGYPDDYRKGDVISGLPQADNLEAKVFHAGTKLEDGKVLTAGGRVLCATALGANVTAAQQAAYQLVDQIHWDGVFSRRDIGYRAIAREKQS
jgi:phosphoribosylamine--glycine ligase